MVGTLTKLAQNTKKFDTDYNDNPRHYVYAEDSPELAKFFQDVKMICLNKIEQEPDLYYPEDIEKLKRQEWMIRRFMNHHKGDKLDSEDPNKTAETVIRMMQWKKKMNLRGMKASDYPREFFEIGLYGQAVTRTGEFLVQCTGKFYNKCLVTHDTKQFHFLDYCLQK